MTYRGVVKGNRIILSDAAHLEDGTEVEVIPLELADPVCDTWQDDRDPGEIAAEIKSARFSRKKDIAL